MYENQRDELPVFVFIAVCNYGTIVLCNHKTTNKPLYIKLQPIVYFNNGDYPKRKRSTWKWQLRMKNDHYYRYN